MATFKLTTKYYIKIHDKNLPGDDGWKCEFELKTGKITELLSPEMLHWVDKFVTYEKIFQEVWDDKGYRSAYTEPIGEKSYRVENIDGEFCVKKNDEETEMER